MQLPYISVCVPCVRKIGSILLYHTIGGKMKRIRLIARQRHFDPKTGKLYSDTELLAINAYYENVFEINDDYNQEMFLLQFEENHPQMRGWLFQVKEEPVLNNI